MPFAVESALSGVMEHHERLWYRRTFSVPTAWKARQLLLHFGAVDYEAHVSIPALEAPYARKSAGV